MFEGGGQSMTEAEWLACSDPRQMLTYLVEKDKLSSREARLFAVACCRRLWPLLTDQSHRQIVELAERHADGMVGDTDLAAARQALPRNAPHSAHQAAQAAAITPDDETIQGHDYFPYAVPAARAAFAAAAETATQARWIRGWSLAGEPGRGGAFSAAQSRVLDDADQAERVAQCQLLRDIVGNPFRELRVQPTWLTWNDGEVVRAARAIYEEGRFADMPRLADLLEQAGCTDEVVLSHCRSGEQHARGCWLLDCFLGKEHGLRPARSTDAYVARRWMECDWPQDLMRDLLAECRPSTRKLRLLACACYRRLGHLLDVACLQDAIDVAERHADGEATDEELAAIHAAVCQVYQERFDRMDQDDRDLYVGVPLAEGVTMVTAPVSPEDPTGIGESVLWAVEFAYKAGSGVWQLNAQADGDVPVDLEEIEERERRAMAELLRDIFGHPFCRTAPLPASVLAWGSGTIPKLAQAMYEDRAFERLPILADALEEAGCTDKPILDHCRESGPHVKGCWVVDLILSKDR
jgi:hypothetical protein